MASIIQNDRIKTKTVFPASQFKTIAIDAVNEFDPQQKILDTIESHDIDNCVVKIVYSVRPEQVYSVNVSKIRERLTTTSFCSITPVVVHGPTRTTLPELNATLHDSPLKALDKYLELKPELDKPELMRKAKMLLEELS